MKAAVPLGLCGVALASVCALSGCAGKSLKSVNEGGTTGLGQAGAKGNDGGSSGDGGSSDGGGSSGAGSSRAPAFPPTLRGQIAVTFGSSDGEQWSASLMAQAWPAPSTPGQANDDAAYLQLLSDINMLTAADGECSDRVDMPLGFASLPRRGLDVGPAFTASADGVVLATGGRSEPTSGDYWYAMSDPSDQKGIELPGTVDILAPAELGLQPNPVTVRVADLGFVDDTVDSTNLTFAWRRTDAEFLLSLYFDGEWDEDDEGQAFFVLVIGAYQCKFSLPPTPVGRFTVGIPREVIDKLPDYRNAYGDLIPYDVDLRPVVFKDVPVTGGGFVRVETGAYIGAGAYHSGYIRGTLE